ncbi:MAG: hypothetical protein U0746_05060 [Gemmataceae bacterium]
MEIFWEKHSGEIMMFLMTAMVLGTLLAVVPQLLRSHARNQEMRHTEHLKAMEQGQQLPPFDVRGRAAGRTTALVPMVSVCAAATVTCFLVAYKSEFLFSVSVAVWAVVGVVSLAAITGGVALMGRMAQLEAGLPDEDSRDEDDGESKA